MIPSALFGVHLVGGVITYEYLGNNQYEVTLRVYRDCAGGGAEFDGAPGSQGPAVLGIFDGNNQFIEVIDLPPPTILDIDPTLSGLCGSVNIPACVEEGIYIKTITLPDNASGYQLVYQRCCRNGTILNIVSPDDTGSTFTAFVPSTSLFPVNNSPVFVNFPPVALCLDVPLEFNHSAIDIDGDELVYSFCTPYSGATPGTPQPVTPSPPPYNEINWAAGYSEDNQITASPAFSIDPNTGLLTGTPTQQGQYVIGICVKEYRDGELVSEVRRDFQFNVLICPNQPEAVFAESQAAVNCQSTVDFENFSENGNTFYWDFGDGQSSSEFEPSHVYQEGGTYDVILVAESDNGCTDTTLTSITITGVPSPNLSPLEFECLNDEEVYSISIDEIDLDNLFYQWELDGSPAFQDATLSLDQVNFPVGDHLLSITVEDSQGCTGTDEVSFTVNPSPVASFSGLDGPCSGDIIEFMSTSTDAETIEWDFGFDGSSNGSNEESVVVTFPSAGSYDISIIASGDNVCPDTYEETLIVSNPVFVELELPDPQCQVGNSSDFIPIGEFAEPANYTWLIQDANNLDPNASSQTNISVSQGGAHVVQLNIVDADGCETSFEGEFITIDPLVVSFETEGTGCIPYSAYFNNTTTGGYGLVYQWTFGDGSTGSVSYPYHTYSQEGVWDVGLTVNSTIGCIESGSYFIEEAITTYPTPEVGFSINPLDVSIIDPTVVITSEVDSVDCNYYISNGDSFTDCNFSYTFDDAGLFEITQYTTNEYGCSSSISHTIRVNGHLFFAPNAVTMNDDGLNDFFKPVIVGDIVEYEMEIYNRWGGLIFRTTDINTYWRPEFAHDGMYVYRVRIRDNYNVPAVYGGSFITIR